MHPSNVGIENWKEKQKRTWKITTNENLFVYEKIAYNNDMYENS